MNIMTKRGTHDNVVTYEHICDSHTDLPNIPQDQIVLGSTAIVLNDNEEGFGVYMADSDKQWVRLMVGSGSGGSFNLSDSFHLCEEGEYDSETGVPTILNPSPDQIYFVPSGSSATGDTFNEWIYVDDGWERFGGGTATIEGGQSDWEEVSGSDPAYILNKPAIWQSATSGQEEISVIMNSSGNIASGPYSVAQGSSTQATGGRSHAEGIATKASGSGSHAEGEHTQATNQAAHAEGYYTTASGPTSHAEGNNSNATGQVAHAEGEQTTASGRSSHTEGSNTTAEGRASHAEGSYTNAKNTGCHAEGSSSQAYSMNSHAEGYGGIYQGDQNNQIKSVAYGLAAHVEGYQNRTSAVDSTSALGAVSSTSYGPHAEGYHTIAGNDLTTVYGPHAEGKGSTASGSASHAEGQETTASATAAHAEGQETYAGDTATHAEGIGGSYSATFSDPGGVTGLVITSAVGLAAHTEGYQTRTINTGGNKNAYGNHAEGYQTTAGQSDTSDIFGAHAEGKQTFATKSGSHAEGILTQALAEGAHAEGMNTLATVSGAHVEGYKTKATAVYAHAEGESTKAKSTSAHAEGYNTTASGTESHAEGHSSTASGNYAHAEGDSSLAYGMQSHAEGDGTKARGPKSHAEGNQSEVTGGCSHAEGYNASYSGANNNTIRPTCAGYASHTEGCQTMIVANKFESSHGSHAEGYRTLAGSDLVDIKGAHAEGIETEASNDAAHAEGAETTASGSYSHAEGNNSTASGFASHAEGTLTIADGMYSHAGGLQTSVNSNATTVIGINNHPAIENNQLINGWANPNLYVDKTVDSYYHPIFIVGNGVDDMGWVNASATSNAMTLFLNGDVCFDGLVYVGQGEQRYNPLNAFYEAGSDGLKYYYNQNAEYPLITPTIASTYVPYIVYYNDNDGLYYYDENGQQQSVNI